MGPDTISIFAEIVSGPIFRAAPFFGPIFPGSTKQMIVQQVLQQFLFT